MIVPVDRRAPRADEVDQLAIVGGDERRAACSLDEKRRATDGAESADRGIYAAWDELEGAGKQLIRIHLEKVGGTQLTYFCTIGILRPTPNATHSDGGRLPML